MIRRWSFLLLLVAMGAALAAKTVDKSDLNNDGTVDSLDLAIFSDLYLEQDYQTVDWCTFYESSVLNPKYFRRIVSDKIEHYTLLLDYIDWTYQCDVDIPQTDKSDLDNDDDVDLDDLELFSQYYLDQPSENVDWCLFHGSTLSGADFEGQPTGYFLEHFTALLSFINIHFDCGSYEPPPNALALESLPKFVARIANATAITGKYYISDPLVGSVFIYDEFLTLSGELKGLNKPLAVAVDALGRILVGNDGRNNVEVYDSSTGDLLAVFGQGLLEMPTAISFDTAGNIYVTDSKRNTVQVFDSSFAPLRTIGSSGVGDATLKFPMDTEILGSEVFVADQGHYRVQVYDLNGNWLRSITFEGTEGQNCNWFTGECEIPGMPPFTKVQALSTDSAGRLHVLDNFAASVIIFDPATGAGIDTYGGYGTTTGLLRVPMDVQISAADLAVVTAGDGGRIEVFTVPQ